MKKKFISFVAYHPTLFLLDRESHYQFGPCYAMLDLGYEVEMVSFNDGTLKIEEDPNYDPRIKITYKKTTLDALRYLWKNRDAVIYANTFILPSLLVGMIGKKTIFFSHDPVFPGKFSPYYRMKKLIVKCCYCFFTKIRVINEYEKNWVKAEGLGEKGVVIPLAISEANQRDEISPKPNILLLGHITEKKNPVTILKALHVVVKRYPELEIYQVGSAESYVSPEGKTYKELIDLFGLEKNMIMKGRVPLREIGHLPTSIYLNSSLMEGQCIAVYDASILGNALCLPNMSSFLGVLDEKVLYHDTFDHEKLAEHIIWYIEHPKEREEYIRANQKWIHEHHNYNFIQKRIQEEFDLL